MGTIRAIRGTSDILPGAVELWQHIETVVRDVMLRFCYEEIRTPIFEETGLFARSIGEDTDIVGKEMYTFTDKGKRSLTLRPECTASVVRAFIEHHLDQRGLPQRLWYMGPMFRQERPQKGRQRQFHQFGVEAIGSPSPYLDAETIVLFDRIAKELGLDQRTVSLNSLGCEESQLAYHGALTSFLERVQDRLCENCQRRRTINPLRVLDCKAPGCREAVREAPDLPKTVDCLTDDDRAHFESVQGALDDADVEYEIDPFLVRGLDYYTGTVYEMNLDVLGAQSAVMGGGRYDRLISELGGPDLPAVGFACGMERLVLALAETDVFDRIKELDRKRVFVVVPSPEHLEAANWQCQYIRDAGHIAETDSLGRSMKAQMKAANRNGADYVLIPESTEVQYDVNVSLKNMKTSKQETMTFEGFVGMLGF